VCEARVVREQCLDGQVHVSAVGSGAGQGDATDAELSLACVPGCNFAGEGAAWLRQGESEERVFSSTNLVVAHPCQATCGDVTQATQAVAQRTCAAATHAIAAACSVTVSGATWSVSLNKVAVSSVLGAVLLESYQHPEATVYHGLSLSRLQPAAGETPL